MKRLFDLIVGLFLLVLSSPAMLVIAILVKLTSQGPIIFCDQRPGYKGKIFTLYKFRGLKHNSKKEGIDRVLSDDPRFTPIGKFIRASRLDELPQLINVIKGDMSLVGPRPKSLAISALLKKEIPDYIREFEVRPGLTGLAQISVPLQKDLEGNRQMVAYNLEYLKNQSFWLDVKILFRTVAVVFRMKGV